MKLISLYIENFGGLSRYTLEFGEGLTVVEAHNGFGKTTLAEFIRAMFYGFPRKGKTLEKSRRQKYTPWNGGKIGGNLVFETGGVRYRLERSFGATPKNDTFALIDLSTNKKSSRYTEEIGLELFGLDSDAFERSTYMPQMAEVGNLSTDSIRSKLSNLVEDTGDVGNYEKALAALKTRRSSYVPYRGSGGSVAQANSRVTQLQEQLRATEALIPTEKHCQTQIRDLESRTQQLQTQMDENRKRFRIASEAAANAALHRRREDMQQLLDRKQALLQGLQETYPRGIPAEDTIESARAVAARLEMLKAQTVTEPEDLEAEAYLAANRNRFAEGVPSREALAAYRSRCEEYSGVMAEARSKGLSRQEQNQYDALKPLFEKGKLEQAYLERLSGAENALKELETRRSALELPESDREKLLQLRQYFAGQIPEAAQLQRAQSELDCLGQLQEENVRLAAEAAEGPEEKKSPVLLILLVMLCLAGTAAGVVLLVQRQFLFGGIALGIGVLALIAAVFAGMKRMVSHALGSAALAQQQTIRANNDRIEELTRSVGAFTGKFTPSDRLEAALYEIRDNREDILKLEERQSRIHAQQLQLDERIRELGRKLRQELGTEDFARQIMDLKLAATRFSDLHQEKLRGEEEAGKLQLRAEEILREITAFLESFGWENNRDLHGSLSELERSADDYTRALLRVKKWREEKENHDRLLQECTRELDAFFERTGIPAAPDVTKQLLQIRDDRKQWEDTAGEMQQLGQELSRFEAENREQLEAPRPDTAEDPRDLKEEEDRLNAALDAARETLLQKQQEHRQLKAQTDEIPQLRDALQYWQEKKQADQHTSNILDDTMAFLEQAKENLSNSYLGPIRRSFAGYMQTLWGDGEGQVLVTADLDVQMERYGAVRELGYFSAGQADLVMLCMRFALVDALFEEERPFVILDDPFVNLDDGHTRQALELLKELSEDRQILYLTCSSSRSPQ